MSIPLPEFEATARRRLDDATFLVVHDRYDSAVYLGGYALEIALKILIAKDKGYSNIPENKGECKSLLFEEKYFTHNLSFLLKESSVCGIIIGNIKHNKDFDFIHKHWSPENRYKTQKMSSAEMIKFLEAIERLIQVIL
jgi:hypothetical protein